MLSISCKYCNKKNNVDFDHKDKIFCNDFCKINYLKKNNKTSKCIICDEEFEHYGEKVICSKKCSEKYTKEILKEIEFFKDDYFFYNFIINSINSKSFFVKKKWGLEIILANNNNYCLKYLIFYKNKSMSFHYHEIKTELWHCIYGDLECIIEKNKKNKKIKFSEGSKIEIEPLTKHQLISNKNSIVVEVSTKDFSEDNFRITSSI